MYDARRPQARRVLILLISLRETPTHPTGDPTTAARPAEILATIRHGPATPVPWAA
ncbi:hypothetical protein NFA_53830 [Nocardia farcinica IFM 10152]|uniref:Uncharacterized protein n=1 Tax=Nocardia farcinica (strain IFM 10152) TaxID=247156 RepID=Q5YNK6_NOCFA|nr:hypothetical protein NFA_53830 [Nocardia farcinica IFM 10152]